MLTRRAARVKSRRSASLMIALAAVLTLTGALTGLVPAAAAAGTCRSRTGAQPPSPGNDNNALNGVVVLSPCNAWAVGSFSGPGPDANLIEHWNGTRWKVVPSPQPGTGGDFLHGIRALTPDNIWAVGSFATAAGSRAEILHWNGRAWKHVTAPAVGDDDTLYGLRPVSAKDIWAVGDASTGPFNRTLILHWNGRTWAHVPSPHPGATGRNNDLSAVGASSGRNAWAVGTFDGGSFLKPLILHWNGRKWVSVPGPGGSASDDELEGVYVISGGNAWAVGIRIAGTKRTGLILHWNGQKWQKAPAPSIGRSQTLDAVGASSASNGWAVGDYTGTRGKVNTLAIHCC